MWITAGSTVFVHIFLLSLLWTCTCPGPSWSHLSIPSSHCYNTLLLSCRQNITFNRRGANSMNQLALTPQQGDNNKGRNFEYLIMNEVKHSPFATDFGTPNPSTAANTALQFRSALLDNEGAASTITSALLLKRTMRRQATIASLLRILHDNILIELTGARTAGSWLILLLNCILRIDWIEFGERSRLLLLLLLIRWVSF